MALLQSTGTCSSAAQAGASSLIRVRLQLWLANLNILSLTNFIVSYTSYDIGAVKETRELTPKYDELKLQMFFLAATPDFYKTVLICALVTLSYPYER